MCKTMTLYGDGVHDDTAAIQALLDRAGDVRLPDGHYCITRPLIIHDNTHFILSAGAHLRLADHANCSLLDNDGLYTRRTNRHITIEGGIFDGNNRSQERLPIADEDLPCDYDTYLSNKLIVLLIRLVHTEHLTVRNVILKDPTSYGIHIADTRYFTVENIYFDYDLSCPNMDGVHIQGPARFGRIGNIMGDCNDDHVALCANGTARSEVTHGAIEDIDVDGVYCENGYTGVRLLSRGDAVRNIRIRNIHGRFRLFAVSFTHHYPLHEGKPVLLENIRLSDLYVSKSTGFVPEGQAGAVLHNALVWFEPGTHCRHIAVDGLVRHETNAATQAPAIHISRGADIVGLSVRGVHQDFPGPPTPVLLNEAGAEVSLAE